MIYYPQNRMENDALSEWCADRIEVLRGRKFENCEAIAVLRGNIVAAVWVFTDWLPENGTMQFSAAASTPRWFTKEAMRALLFYPFQTVRANKLWCVMAADNRRAIKVAKGIGFKQEATLRHHFGNKRHGVVCAMMRAEYSRSPWFMEAVDG